MSLIKKWQEKLKSDPVPEAASNDTSVTVGIGMNSATVPSVNYDPNSDTWRWQMPLQSITPTPLFNKDNVYFTINYERIVKFKDWKKVHYMQLHVSRVDLFEDVYLVPKNIWPALSKLVKRGILDEFFYEKSGTVPRGLILGTSDPVGWSFAISPDSASDIII